VSANEEIWIINQIDFYGSHTWYVALRYLFLSFRCCWLLMNNWTALRIAWNRIFIIIGAQKLFALQERTSTISERMRTMKRKCFSNNKQKSVFTNGNYYLICVWPAKYIFIRFNWILHRIWVFWLSLITRPIYWSLSVFVGFYDGYKSWQCSLPAS
jgi:hypothetical protein